MPRGEKLVIKVFACLAGASLVVSWLLVSTLGENNDLGLRAILLAEVVLIVMTAAGMAGLQSGSLRAPIMAAAFAGLVLSVPDFILTMRDNIVAPQQPPDAKVFAEAPSLVGRGARHAAPTARIANNPRLPRRPHAVAGEYILGVARQPLIVFCRPRNGYCVCAAAARASRRSRRRVCAGV